MILHCFLIFLCLCCVSKAHPSMDTVDIPKDAMKSRTACWDHPIQYLGHSNEIVPPPLRTAVAARTKLLNNSRDFSCLAFSSARYLSPFFAQHTCCQVDQGVHGMLAWRWHPGVLSINLHNLEMCSGSYISVCSLHSLTQLIPLAAATLPSSLSFEQQNS